MVNNLPQQIEDTLDRLKVDTEYFFRMAYAWRFRDKVFPSFGAVSHDAQSYKAFCIVPQYVKDYLAFIHKETPQEVVPQMDLFSNRNITV